MRRVQIQVPDDQYARLLARAAAAGESIAATVRRALDAQDAADQQRRRAEAARAAIRTAHFTSGLVDVAQNHDEYFVRGIEERIGRR
jgi:plasmid stability protein